MTRPAWRALAALGLLAVLALAGAPDALAQCVMCKTALTASSEGRAMSGSFNRAILLMMFAPYAILAAVGAVLFRRPLAQRLLRLRPAGGPWGAAVRRLTAGRR